jgi:glutamyl endopeptidase
MPRKVNARRAPAHQLQPKVHAAQIDSPHRSHPGSVSENFSAQLVFGPDDRKQVTNTLVFPARAIAQVLVRFNAGPDEFGTGFFIAPDLVITAAHVFVQSGRTAAFIRVVPGRNGAASAPFGFADSQMFRPSAGWIRNQAPEADYGAIRLTQPLGNTVGFFGLHAFTDPELAATAFDVAGYPTDKPVGTMWDHHGPVAPSPAFLTYQMDTAGGQSGAPVLAAFPTGVFVAGIHTGGDPLANRAVRITPLVLGELLSLRDTPAT